jgi:hypothetical protein
VAPGHRQRAKSDSPTLRNLSLSGPESPQQSRTVPLRSGRGPGEQHGRDPVGYLKNISAPVHLPRGRTLLGHFALVVGRVRLLQTRRGVRPRDVVHSGDSHLEHGGVRSFHLFRKLVEPTAALVRVHAESRTKWKRTTARTTKCSVIICRSCMRTSRRRS